MKIASPFCLAMAKWRTALIGRGWRRGFAARPRIMRAPAESGHFPLQLLLK